MRRNCDLRVYRGDFPRIVVALPVLVSRLNKSDWMTVQGKTCCFRKSVMRPCGFPAAEHVLCGAFEYVRFRFGTDVVWRSFCSGTGW